MVILSKTNIEEINVYSPIPKGVAAEITINGKTAYADFFPYDYPNCADKIVSVLASNGDTLTTFSTLSFGNNEVADPQTVNIKDSNGTPYSQNCNFQNISYNPINYNLTNNLTIVIVNLVLTSSHTVGETYYQNTYEAAFIVYGTLLGYIQT